MAKVHVNIWCYRFVKVYTIPYYLLSPCYLYGAIAL